MNNDRFEQDLRSLLARNAPAEVPSGFREQVVGTPYRMPRVNRLAARRLFASGFAAAAVIAAVLLAVGVSQLGPAATASPSPSVLLNVDATGILLVNAGEQIQARPPNEEMAVAFNDALMFAAAHGDDVGYPWIDPSSGELVLSAVTPAGRSLLEAASITVPHRIRDVTHGAAELRRIQDDVTFLHSRGVVGSELIYATVPDQRDNRALIVISAMSRPLLEYLAAHYPPDALAVEVDPSRAPAAVTPTSDATASGPPPPTCVAPDVSVRGGRMGGGTGTAHVDLFFTNFGPGACTLAGAPISIAFFRVDGSQLSIATLAPDPNATGGAPAVLAPGMPDAASVAFNWSNWCGAAPGPLHVRLTIPGGGTLTGPLDGPPESNFVPRCDQPTEPSGLELLWGFASPSP